MTIVDTSLSISQAAERTGLSTHTLRYYERAGLMITDVDRASSTHRRYTDADIAWVEFLAKLRATAMPIAIIREYVDLVRLGDIANPDRLALLVAHRENVIAQLDEMATSLRAIDTKIALYKKGKLN
jgi:DNA-binding transcriptional MerR regulator